MTAPSYGHYRRGVTFERRVASLLEKDGYYVMRGAGSHGKADLIALKWRHAVLVQCKIGGPARVSPAEWNALWQIACNLGAVAVIAFRPTPKKVEYLKITGPKRPGVRLAPCKAWAPDEVAATDIRTIHAGESP